MNSGVMLIFVFSLFSRFRKKDRHTAPFAALFHCSCHCSSHFLLISLATYVIGILLNTMFVCSSSWAASLASVLCEYLPSSCYFPTIKSKYLSQTTQSVFFTNGHQHRFVLTQQIRITVRVIHGMVPGNTVWT